ncbi:hypothetical protein D3C74_183120 [compost metagenome]
MGVLGQLKIKDFLEKTQGLVRGSIITDAKNRWYSSDYKWSEDSTGNLTISRTDGFGDKVIMKPVIDLDESLVSFFGLYSGDGSKGSEVEGGMGRVKPSISFSQREPNLVKFAYEQFNKIFPGSIRFNFSLGEDSAFFMDGTGLEYLRQYYKGNIPPTPDLSIVRPNLNEKDSQYLSEKRPVQGTNEEHLAFYYFHKKAMETILSQVKLEDINECGIVLNKGDSVTASLRRPFKKGARLPGGSSRSDEMHVGGLNGFGEFFLKMLHEIEDSILHNTLLSDQALVLWSDIPSRIGEEIDIECFFTNHPYGEVAGKRPVFDKSGISLKGTYPSGSKVTLNSVLNIDPLWCYVSGLYLAEGSTPKSSLFRMFVDSPGSMALGFTSSEGISLELVLRALSKLFNHNDCVHTWKVKVGSQYFTELVVIGLKNGVPMLRGGASGDGKLRTMEISLAIKKWALEVAPCLVAYADKYSHVEPTGAGLARIDFSASSSLCRWYFPLLMYSVFGQQISDPKKGFSV